MYVKRNLRPLPAVHGLIGWLSRKGPKVTVSSRQFHSWLKNAGLPETGNDLAARAGVNRGTLHQQLSRDRVQVSTIIAVARGWDLHVLTAISFFPTFGDIDVVGDRLSEAEVLSQITSNDILVELVSRISREDAARLQPGRILQPFPFDGSMRLWMEAIDTGNLRKRLSESHGITSGNLSAQLTENRLSLEVALASARLAGTPPVNAFVVTGLLQPGEAGWPQGARETALSSLSDIDLAALSEVRTAQITKTVRRKAHTEAVKDRYLDALG